MPSTCKKKSDRMCSKREIIKIFILRKAAINKKKHKKILGNHAWYVCMLSAI